jgi:hypothetical protein
VTALSCLRYLADENEPLADGTDDVADVLRERAVEIDPNDQLLLSEVHDIPPAAAWLAGLVDELIRLPGGLIAVPARPLVPVRRPGMCMC